MLSNEEWRQKLAPEEYRVLRESGTEAPFTNRYYLTDASGAYCCAGCGAQLFDSREKFHSSCGWPAFSSNTAGSIEEAKDTSHFMVRTEVKCSGCGGHLGHLFDDGPTETGMRYCINSASLKFVPEEK